MIVTKTREELYEKFLPKESIGAEIGVCRGANAVSLYNIVQPKSLHLVDVWKCEPLTYRYHPQELRYDDWEADVKQLFSGRENVQIYKMISDYYFSILRSSSPRFKFDWLYIDADHNRAGIDLANALDFCVQDSIIMMHDFMVHPNAWDTNTVVPVLEQIQKGSVVPVGISNEQFPTIVLRVT